MNIDEVEFRKQIISDMCSGVDHDTINKKYGVMLDGSLSHSKKATEYVNKINCVYGLVNIVMKKINAKIGNYEYPEPETETLKFKQRYYFVDFCCALGASTAYWGGEKVDVILLQSGVIHLTLENAQKHHAALVAAMGAAKNV